jgi:hypothetical protein
LPRPTARSKLSFSSPPALHLAEHAVKEPIPFVDDQGEGDVLGGHPHGVVELIAARVPDLAAEGEAPDLQPRAAGAPHGDGGRTGEGE